MPLEIFASVMGPKGRVEFIGNRQKQRSALLLASDRRLTVQGHPTRLQTHKLIPNPRAS
jgi:hypothetical protein